jgi:hypothetical protein
MTTRGAGVDLYCARPHRLRGTDMRTGLGSRGIRFCIALGMLVASAAAIGQTVIPVGPFSVSCTSSGLLCSPPFTVTVTTTGLLQASYTASTGHCSNISVHFLVDGVDVAATPFLTPGQASGTFDLGPVSAGTHTLGFQGEGQVGGCNAGTTANWGGSALVTIVAPVTSNAVAVPGPGLFLTALALLVGVYFTRRIHR